MGRACLDCTIYICPTPLFTLNLQHGWCTLLCSNGLHRTVNVVQITIAYLNNISQQRSSKGDNFHRTGKIGWKIKYKCSKTNCAELIISQAPLTYHICVVSLGTDWLNFSNCHRLNIEYKDWSPKFETGLSIIIDIVQKVQEWPSCPWVHYFG